MRPTLVTFVAAIGACASQALAQDVMTFRADPPDPRYLPVVGTAWTILAVGVIDSDAPTRIQTLIRENNIPVLSTIYLDSPGGNLIAAMELGRIIREHGFNTDVGRPSRTGESSPGKCLSACTITFLGGRFRYVTRGSVYGVHRFFADGQLQDPLATGQIMSAQLLQYIREMGADPSLLDEMSKAGEDEVNVLSESQLAALEAVSKGVEWLEST